jgi:hypothetical protein
MQQEPIDLANRKKVYFDTSAWDYVSKHARREEVVNAIRQSRTVVLASVISVAEALRTRNPRIRESICSTILILHGDGHLLERPQDLTVAAAEAFLRGEKDVTLPRTESGQAIYTHLMNPTSPPSKALWDWLHNMDNNLNRFIEKTRPQQRDLKTRYCTSKVLEREDFLQILCELPPTRHLKFSISQMRDLCQASDIWQAQAAALAYMIELSVKHAPKSKHGKKRPRGPDLWQTVYLGVSEIFVTGDEELLKAASSVSACLRYPRCVVSRESFIDGMPRGGGESTESPAIGGLRCRLCGCNLGCSEGMHANALPL